MYAVIKTGGKQYRVQPGDVLVVEKLVGDPGASVAFGDVLLLGDGDAVTVGAPTVAGASVAATLIETRKGEKVKIFKKKRRQGYRRTLGHRQHESVLRVVGITAGGKETKWDGTVDLTTKAELDARARGLNFETMNQPRLSKAQKAAAAAPVAKAKPAKVPKAIDVAAEPVIDDAAAAAPAQASVTEAPATDAPAKAKTPAAPKKAAAPEAKAKADTAEPKAAPKKAATPKKDKSAE
jgi:large subunit ribosomal protein L21